MHDGSAWYYVICAPRGRGLPPLSAPETAPQPDFPGKAPAGNSSRSSRRRRSSTISSTISGSLHRGDRPGASPAGSSSLRAQGDRRPGRGHLPLGPDREKLLAAIVSGAFPPPLKIDNIVADQLAGRQEDLEAFPAPGADPGRLARRHRRGGAHRRGHPRGAGRGRRPHPLVRQKVLQTETYLAVPLHYREGAARRPRPGQPRGGEDFQQGAIST